MKKIGFLLLFLSLAQIGLPQFVPMPLDYTGDGSAHLSWFISIVDENCVWVGTVRQGTNGYLPYPVAVKTTDGGNTWQFDTIPVPGTPWIQHLAAWDANICYYLFTDGVTYGGSIWKTIDGGTTWSKKTTTQFTGGWADFIHVFSADTVLAMGDPNGGSFEIQLTYDGGNSWTRVTASNIPTPITGETGTSGDYCAVGNTIWFPTSKGRCFKSSDRGLHWTATMVTPGYLSICFTDTLKGIGYYPGTAMNFYLTTDGGSTWTPHTSPVSHYWVGGMSRIPGISNAFVVSAWDSTTVDTTNVFFTPDFFNTIAEIDSNIRNASGFIYFKSTSIGWLSGSYNNYHNIHKFIGMLTSVKEKSKADERIQIIPNPGTGEALVQIPANYISGKTILKITDVNGRTIFEENVNTSSGWIRINSSSWSNGIYFVELLSGSGETLCERWIVHH